MESSKLILPHETLPEAVRQQDDTPAVERLRDSVARRTVGAIVLGYVGAAATATTYAEAVNSYPLPRYLAAAAGVVCMAGAVISQSIASYYAHAVHRVEMTCPQTEVSNTAPGL